MDNNRTEICIDLMDCGMWRLNGLRYVYTEMANICVGRVECLYMEAEWIGVFGD